MITELVSLAGGGRFTTKYTFCRPRCAILGPPSQVRAVCPLLRTRGKPPYMGLTPGDAEPDDASEQMNRQAENLQKEIESLAAQLAGARELISQLNERLRVQSAELRRESQVQARMRAVSKRLERQALMLKHDNAVARKLQKGLRPPSTADFEGIQFAVETIPGERVSGDFYDIIRISDSCAGLLIAGVSGYGLAAAVVMAQARMAFRTFATMESSPKAILERVNDSLLEETLAGHHLTAFMGLLDTEMLTFQYVNASHCPAYLIHEGDVTPLDTEGLFVGMFDDPRYEQKSIQLERNDKLLLFTDWLVRLFDGEAWDRARSKLEDYLRESSDSPIHKLIQRLSEVVIRESSADVAMLGIELLRSKARHKKISIYSVPMEVLRVENMVLPAVSAKGYGERALFAIRLALEEAVSNAIQHGNKLDNTKKVTVDFTLDDDKVVMAVTDQGEGFDPSSLPDPTLDENLEATSGRGIALMKAYMDSVEFNEKANKVTMTKLAPWHTPKTPEQRAEPKK